MQFSYGGQTISKPGGYSIVNTQSQSLVQAGNQRVLLFIGAANGGQPQTVQYFNDPKNASQVLRGGDLLNAMNLAWNPSKAVDGENALPGADVIGVIRTDTATQAVLTLKDAVPTTGATLTSKIYGTDGNATVVKVGVGTNTNTQKVTFTDPAGILPTETYDNLATATTFWQALVTAVNSGNGGFGSNFFTAAIGVSTATSATTGTFSPATGTQTAGTTTDFQNALTVAQNEAVDGIVALTATQAIQAMVQNHVDTMSNVQWKRERRAFTGSAATETAATSITNAAAFADSRMAYVWPGGYQKIGGVKTLFPGYLVACMVAGLWAGQAPNQSVTFKYLNLVDIETQADIQTMNNLLNGGVLPIEKAFGVAGGFRVVHGLTTSLGTNPDGTPNLALQLLEVASLIDYITRDFRTSIQKKFTGTPGSSTKAGEMNSYAITKLEGYVGNGYLVNGFNPDTGKNDLPAYEAPTTTQSGNQYTTSYRGRPSVEVDYELIQETFVF